MSDEGPATVWIVRLRGERLPAVLGDDLVPADDGLDAERQLLRPSERLPASRSFGRNHEPGLGQAAIDGLDQDRQFVVDDDRGGGVPADLFVFVLEVHDFGDFEAVLGHERLNLRTGQMRLEDAAARLAEDPDVTELLAERGDAFLGAGHQLDQVQIVGAEQAIHGAIEGLHGHLLKDAFVVGEFEVPSPSSIRPAREQGGVEPVSRVLLEHGLLAAEQVCDDTVKIDDCGHLVALSL